MFVAPCTALNDIAGIVVECVMAWAPEDMPDIADPEFADAELAIAVEDAAILLVVCLRCRCPGYRRSPARE
jgi:hypothetical protein